MVLNVLGCFLFLQACNGAGPLLCPWREPFHFILQYMCASWIRRTVVSFKNSCAVNIKKKKQYEQTSTSLELTTSRTSYLLRSMVENFIVFRLYVLHVVLTVITTLGKHYIRIPSVCKRSTFSHFKITRIVVFSSVSISSENYTRFRDRFRTNAVRRRYCSIVTRPRVRYQANVVPDEKINEKNARTSV